MTAINSQSHQEASASNENVEDPSSYSLSLTWDEGPGRSVTNRYPKPPSVGGVSEVIHGVEILDPWRELETLESEQTKKFIREQNEFSKPYLDSHPLRAKLESSVTDAYSYRHSTAPASQGDGWYYWLYNDGISPRDVMVRSREVRRDHGGDPYSLGSGLEIVFDPSRERNVSLYMYSWSPSGRYFCAILQESGSDWQTIRTIDTQTKLAVEPDLRESKFTFGTTFITEIAYLYKRLIRPDHVSFSEEDGQYGLYYHEIGTPQSDDILVWAGFGPLAKSLIVGRPRVCSADEMDESRRKWVLVDVYCNTNPETEVVIFEMPSNGEMADGREVARRLHSDRRWMTQGFTGETTYVGTLSSDTIIFLSTSNGYPSGRIITLDPELYDSTPPDTLLQTAELVPPDPDGHVLRSAHLVADSVIILVYLRHACAAIEFVDAKTGLRIGSTDAHGTRGHAKAHLTESIPVPDGEISHVEAQYTPSAVVIPDHASISAVSSRSDASDFYLAVDTFVAPSYILSGSVNSSTSAISIERLDSDATDDAKHDDLVCRQVFYDSHDSVQIPLFICHAGNLDMSRPQPTLLHAYGGFGVSLLPHYDPFFCSFMRDLKGIVAIANIRGGGEYGKKWHEAALGLSRPVAWTDFVYAARYLHTRGITTPSLTGIYGSSNGGLLVAACAGRNPELFGAVCPDVALTDLVRYQKFTLGRLWVAEYGSSDDPASLPSLHDSSPLHNVKANDIVEYPAFFMSTGDHDTRVIPGHTLKYIAELQSKKPKNRKPFMTRIYEDAGHESGSKTTKQKVAEAVDRLVFLVENLVRTPETLRNTLNISRVS